MKKTVLFSLVLVLSVVMVVTGLVWAIEMKKAPAPPLTPPALQKPLTPISTSPRYTSTVPSPLRLTPGKNQLTPAKNQFTITGNNLDYVKSLALVNSRRPVFLLPASIVSKTKTAMTVTVNVPKYLAPGPYQIQAVSGAGVTDTGLIAEADENKPCDVWTEFNPLLHGFYFYNDRWGDVCYKIVRGHLEYSQGSSLCGSDWGLCGGMSLNAGERFSGGVTGTHDLTMTKDAAKPALVNAQFRTLDGPTVAKFFEWMYSPDEGHRLNPYHSVGYRMSKDWNELIKPQLDAHKPVVLGLIFDKMATLIKQLDPTNVADLFKQHQVLGIGYSNINAATKRIYAYDPSIPDDILILTFTGGTTGVAQALESGRALPASRRKARGVMFVRSVP
jgi:hypothetical protein